MKAVGNVSLITECSTQEWRRETGWKSKEVNSQTKSKVQSERVGLKKVRRCQGTKML